MDKMKRVKESEQEEKNTDNEKIRKLFSMQFNFICLKIARANENHEIEREPPKQRESPMWTQCLNVVDDSSE